MLLDFLPYTVPQKPRKKIGWIRYIMFAASLIFVASLFLAHVGNIGKILFTDLPHFTERPSLSDLP